LKRNKQREQNQLRGLEVEMLAQQTQAKLVKME